MTQIYPVRWLGGWHIWILPCIAPTARACLMNYEGTNRLPVILLSTCYSLIVKWKKPWPVPITIYCTPIWINFVSVISTFFNHRCKFWRGLSISSQTCVDCWYQTFRTPICRLVLAILVLITRLLISTSVTRWLTSSPEDDLHPRVQITPRSASVLKHVLSLQV
jgi:hypothetical protein